MTAMRILHIGKYFPPDVGGMETYLADLIAAQQAQGLDVHALVHGTPHRDDPQWLTRVPCYGKLLYAPLAPGFRRALKRCIAGFAPDVLHIHLPNTSAFWALTADCARDIPWVIHWHSDVVTSRIRRKLALAYRLYRPFEQAMLAQAHAVIATSPDYLAASEPLSAWRAKSVAIPLGLHIQTQPKTSQTPAHWQPGMFRLLSIGRLAYYKGFTTLIRAVAQLPNVELLIAGDGESHRELAALIAESTPAGQPPRTRLLGHVSEDQKAQLLAECELFCLASRERTEAFGMVLLEAMKHGKPCLVSDLQGSGMPWIVRTSSCGDVVAVGDVASWQSAIAHMQESPQRRVTLGKNGRSALCTRFDIRRSSRQLTKTYAAICPEKTSASTRNKLLIVIPAKNESASIGEVVTNLIKKGYTEVVVINDQSSDDTAELALAAGASVLSLPLPLGAWGAMQTGIRFGMRHGFTSIVTMDADGQHEVGEIPSLLALSSQADVVIGACPGRGSPARKMAWAWFRKLTGLSFEDLTSGFRYYNLSAMELLARGEATLFDYQDIGVLLLLRRHGMRIAEVPVSMRLRSVGKSRIFYSWLAVANYMLETSLLCLARWGTHAHQRTKP
jgi:glycosyltransferase involved in cell wall biosynthesis